LATKVEGKEVTGGKQRPTKALH